MGGGEYRQRGGGEKKQKTLTAETNAVAVVESLSRHDEDVR